MTSGCTPVFKITTQATTIAPGAKSSFTVSKPNVYSNSIIFPTLYYSGTAIPIVTISGVSSGTFTVNVYNAHATNSITTSLMISFLHVSTGSDFF
jgi:hypothetical protein